MKEITIKLSDEEMEALESIAQDNKISVEEIAKDLIIEGINDIVIDSLPDEVYEALVNGANPEELAKLMEKHMENE